MPKLTSSLPTANATPPVPKPPPQPCTLDQLTQRSCRWPIGDGPFMFCGATSLDLRPYCQEHTDRGYHRIAR